MKTEVKHFKQCNYFNSLKGNLIVVSTGRVKGERFEGVIIYDNDSETNVAPYHSNEFMMNKFELVDKENIKVSFND